MGRIPLAQGAGLCVVFMRSGAHAILPRVEFLLRAIVLGVVQGLTEFLPVSSSGHLILVRSISGWPDEGLAFDAALHLGTLFAVLVYFRVTWMRLLRGRDRRLLTAILLGTFPAGVAGLLGEHWINQWFRDPRTVGVFFFSTAVVLFLADRFAARREQNRAVVGRADAFVIGCAQAIALFPGLSRSGITIAAGMLRGFSRAQAVEFSFLLGAPITAAAGLQGVRNLVALSPGEVLPAAVGLLAAFAAALIAIRVLLRAIRTRTFLSYVVYLVLVGTVVLFW